MCIVELASNVGNDIVHQPDVPFYGCVGFDLRNEGDEIGINFWIHARRRKVDLWQVAGENAHVGKRRVIDVNHDHVRPWPWPQPLDQAQGAPEPVAGREG